MSDIAVRIENLGKQYRLGESKPYRTFRESIYETVSSPWRRLFGPRGGETPPPSRNGRNGEDTIWALKDVSLEVPRGEVLGIIGRNGAGKSTLLKILSRITEPTTGRVEIHGRVGSLLEVGTGFHPELTGRENIFVNGAILGMTRAEIKRKFDEIVDFSGVERFIDTPVKRYSSGMSVRLAFAVAAHLDPEILIVDEVLAVGDAEFQKKCLGKMGDVARGGRTVLFVSHNMQAIRALCNRALLLDQGQLFRDAEVNQVIDTYLSTALRARTEQAWDAPDVAPGNEWIRLHRIRLVAGNGRDPNGIGLETPLRIECHYWNLRGNTHLNLSMHLYNGENVCVFNTSSARDPRWHGQSFPVGLFRSVCHIPGSLLNDGTYRVKLMFVKDMSRAVCVFDDVLVFDVHEYDRGSNWHGKIPGVVRPLLEWSTEAITDRPP